ncbi:hypothetical protein [Paenibacillus hexagrammi]|uniref:Poly(3-hydroxybutyrate) depolymerase n=1 Tax=Paenibacillus hexagrammi TaxID=2908839 RepID=A0ABY3SBM2_9BACL|nr:hypothetical protein [Paenibacillus sp. YPD9-1]UJF31349.1 hypothetical protein L0M14_16050 [Paenibacillus sp. YPD9-1]
MELQAYLEKLVAITHCPITFSGDVPNALSRWLIRSIKINEERPMGTQPYLDTSARLLMFNELAILDKSELENNWRQYIADMVDRYQEVNTPKGLFTVGPHTYMYALNTVYCEQARDVMVNVITFHPTPLRMWINGELVIAGNHKYLVKDYFFLFRFREGSNTVLIETPLSLEVPVANQEIVVKLNPLESLVANGKEFLDDDLLSSYMNTYSVFLEKAMLETGETLRFLVLPRYAGGERERIRVRLSTVTGESLLDEESCTSEVISTQLPPDFQGLLRIQADSIGSEGKAGKSHLYVGDILHGMEKALQQASLRSDLDPGIPVTVKELIELPQAFQALNQYVPAEMYQTIFPVLESFLQYLGQPERTVKQGYPDVFGSTFTVYEQQPNSDRLSAYTVTLPEQYHPSNTYPLVIYFHDAQARSFPMDLPWAKRSSISEAIIVNMVGIGRMNYVDDVMIMQRISRLLETYPIDRNRIHLIGFCTGGPKTYRIAMQSPDVFAGIASLVGDMRLSINEPEYDRLANVSNMSVMGMLCTENWFFNSSRKLHFLKQLPKARAYMFHGFMHNEFNSLMNSKAMLRMLIEHQRDPYPKEVSLNPLEPYYNKSYWIKLEAAADLQQKSYVKTTITTASQIDIQMTNTASLCLFLSREHMALQSQVNIKVNGTDLAIHLPDYAKVRILEENGTYRTLIRSMSASDFEREYNEISVDYRVLGIKQAYLHACKVVKPEGPHITRRCLASKLAYLLQNPIKDRYIYYRYESCTVEEFERVQVDSSQSAYVLILDAAHLNDWQRQLLSRLNIQLDEQQLIYRKQTYQGTCFAFILCQHPESPDTPLLLVLYNDPQVESEMIGFMNSFDTNPIFYNDAVVYHEGQYHGFRDWPAVLTMEEWEDESTFVGQHR